MGNRPKIIYTWNSYAINIRFYGNPTLQQNSSTRIVWLDVSATKNADALVRLSSNTTVENCYLHNAQWWIRSTWDPIWQPSNIQNVKIKNSVIEDIADDGIMIQDVNWIIIEDNLIRTVNQNYYLVWPSQQQAAWDGIQFVANANWKLLNNRIDRSDTANKFNFISSYDKAVPPNTAIIEWNTFISPMTSSEGWAIFYASNHVWVWYQNTWDWYNVYVRNNIFSWALPWTALSAVWYHWENLYSSGNVYKNMTSCLTNRRRKNWLPQVPIYSNWDIFILCSNDTIGNVIVDSSSINSILSGTNDYQINTGLNNTWFDDNSWNNSIYQNYNNISNWNLDVIWNESTDDIIENKKPNTIISKIQSLNNWKIRIYLKSTDDKKVKKTYYKVWYLSWKSARIFSVKYKKNMFVRFYSVDYYWNKESIKKVQIQKKWWKYIIINK